jgi:hypothetical protein
MNAHQVRRTDNLHHWLAALARVGGNVRDALEALKPSEVKALAHYHQLGRLRTRDAIAQLVERVSAYQREGGGR